MSKKIKDSEVNKGKKSFFKDIKENAKAVGVTALVATSLGTVGIGGALALGLAAPAIGLSIGYNVILAGLSAVLLSVSAFKAYEAICNKKNKTVSSKFKKGYVSMALATSLVCSGVAAVSVCNIKKLNNALDNLHSVSASFNKNSAHASSFVQKLGSEYKIKTPKITA